MLPPITLVRRGRALYLNDSKTLIRFKKVGPGGRRPMSCVLGLKQRADEEPIDAG